MNMETSGVMAPPAPRTIAEMKIPLVIMRDILLKTMFRMNMDQASDLAKAVCLPLPVTQELIDMARDQTLIEATGTLHAGSGGKMGYQLTENGKARALDALAQSEYYGAMPVPLDVYREQVKRQSIRNIQITRGQLTGAMGHLVLPPDLLSNLGPAVSSGRSILMYGPPGNGKSSISNGIRDALGDKIFVPRAIEYTGQVITVYDPIVHSAAESQEDDPNKLRRIFFKIKIDGPSQEDFLKIFAMVAKKKKMPLDEKALVHLLKVKYPTIDNVYANYQPIFLIDQMISICEFEGIPYQMSPELIDRAWANMFVKEETIVH